jgi:hypothetical protein
LKNLRERVVELENLSSLVEDIENQLEKSKADKRTLEQ